MEEASESSVLGRILKNERELQEELQDRTTTRTTSGITSGITSRITTRTTSRTISRITGTTELQRTRITKTIKAPELPKQQKSSEPFELRTLVIVSDIWTLSLIV